MATLIQRTINLMNNKFKTFESVKQTPKNPLAIYSTYFLLGSLFTLVKVQPKEITNALVLIEQGDELPSVYFGFTNDDVPPIDKILTLHLAIVNFNDFQNDTIELENAKEVVFRLATVSEKFMFKIDRMKIKYSSQNFIEIVMDKSDKYASNITTYIQEISNHNTQTEAEEKTGGKKFKRLDSSNIQNKFNKILLEFENYFNFSEPEFYENKMRAYISTIKEGYMRFLERLQPRKQNLQTMFAFFDGVISSEFSNSDTIIVESMIEEMIIVLRFIEKPFSLMIRFSTKEMKIPLALCKQRAIFDHVVVIDFIQHFNGLWTENTTFWMYVAPLNFLNLFIRENSSEILSPHSQLFKHLKHHMTPLKNQELDKESAGSFLLGDFLAKAFTSRKCRDMISLSKCLEIPHEIDHALHLKRKIKNLKHALVRNTTEITPMNTYALRVLQNVLIECRVGKIILQNFIAGFLDNFFILCRSPSWKILCFLDMNEGKTIFVHVKHSVSITHVAVKKSIDSSQQEFLESVYPTLSEDVKYELVLLLVTGGKYTNNLFPYTCLVNFHQKCNEKLAKSAVQEFFNGHMSRKTEEKMQKSKNIDHTSDNVREMFTNAIRLPNIHPKLYNSIDLILNKPFIENLTITDEKFDKILQNWVFQKIIQPENENCLIYPFIQATVKFVDEFSLSKIRIIIDLNFIFSYFELYPVVTLNLTFDDYHNTSFKLINLKKNFNENQKFEHYQSHYSKNVQIKDFQILPTCDCQDPLSNDNLRQNNLLKRMLYIIDREEFDAYYRPHQYCQENLLCAQQMPDNMLDMLSDDFDNHKKEQQPNFKNGPCNMFEYHSRLSVFFPFETKRYCKNFIGLTRSIDERKIASILIDINHNGTNFVQTKPDSRTTFLIGSGHKEVNGSNLDDIFIVNATCCKGYLNGGPGSDLIKISSSTSSVTVNFRNYWTEILYSDNNWKLFLYNIENYILDQHVSFVHIHTCGIDEIDLYKSTAKVHDYLCVSNLTFIVRKEAKIVLKCRQGHFIYNLNDGTETLTVEGNSKDTLITQRIDMQHRDITDIENITMQQNQFFMKVGKTSLQGKGINGNFVIDFKNSFKLFLNKNGSLHFEASLNIKVFDIIHQFKSQSIRLTIPMFIYSILDKVIVFFDGYYSPMFSSNKRQFTIINMFAHMNIHACVSGRNIFKISYDFSVVNLPKTGNVIVNLTISQTADFIINENIIDLSDLCDLVVDKLELPFRVNVRSVTKSQTSTDLLSYLITPFVEREISLTIAKIQLINVTESSLFSSWRLVMDQEYKFMKNPDNKFLLVPLAHKVDIPGYLITRAKPKMRFQFDYILHYPVFLWIREDIVITPNLSDAGEWEDENLFIILIKDAWQVTNMTVEFLAPGEKKVISFEPHQVAENLSTMIQVLNHRLNQSLSTT